MAIQTALPGYWTPSEIARWIGVTERTIHYKLKGRGDKEPTLFGYDLGGIHLVPQAEAERFIVDYLRDQGEDGAQRLAKFLAVAGDNPEQVKVLQLSQPVAFAS